MERQSLWNGSTLVSYGINFQIRFVHILRQKAWGPWGVHQYLTLSDSGGSGGEERAKIVWHHSCIAPKWDEWVWWCCSVEPGGKLFIIPRPAAAHQTHCNSLADKIQMCQVCPVQRGGRGSLNHLQFYWEGFARLECRYVPALSYTVRLNPSCGHCSWAGLHWIGGDWL